MTTVRVQRCCNGCGRSLRDATRAECEAAIEGHRLPDVRSECGCVAAYDPAHPLDAAVRVALAASREVLGGDS